MNQSALGLFYPEVNFGGFTSVDGTIQFYSRVNSLITKDCIVLDLGAGRGSSFELDNCAYRLNLLKLKGKCKKVIGIDIDPIVLTNPNLDVSLLIKENEIFPLDNNSVDVIVCDHTMEHIINPDLFSSEIYRVLKPNGYFCARTPNIFGYIGLGSVLIPNFLHLKILKYVQPDRMSQDVFPAFYKLNSRRSVKKYFCKEKWNIAMYTWNSEPAYFGNMKIFWAFMLFVFRLLPSFFGTTWNIFMRKN